MSAKENIKILVAQDEKFLFNYLKLKVELNRLPFILQWAKNGQIVLHKVKQGNKYHVILMSLEMPLRDSFSFSKIIRRLGGAIPIIACAYCDKSLKREACQRVGINDYIEVDSQTFLKDVVDALHRCRVLC